MKLSDSHRRMLVGESGIDPGVVSERGYGTAWYRSELADFPDWQRRLGLRIPMFSPDGITGSCQLRPNKPRKNGPKYETPQGSGVIIDVHPRMHEEARSGSGDLWITEGCKKADALVSRGLCAIALAGVWMAHVPKSKPKRLLPCWDHVNLKRRVFVAFDSDAVHKEGVQSALAWLVSALAARGADVVVCYLPDAANGSKWGADDYLASGRTVAELKVLARKFEPADVGIIRMSRDAKLSALVGDLRARWWAEEWKGRGGHSERDVALKLIEAATRSGKAHGSGIRVKVSWGVLQVGAKVSRRTLAKALVRLEARGFVHRDNGGRKVDKTGAFVLKASPRAKVDQGGGEVTQGTQELRACDRGGLPLRAPRLRWSRPKFTPKRGTVAGTFRVRESKPPEPRDRIERLGKIRGAIVDALEVAGGTLTLVELCEVLHRKRARDVKRRILPMLEEAGIIERADDVITLAADWSGRLDDARRVGGEIEADELDEGRRKRKSRAYRRRHEAPVSEPSAAGLEAIERSHEKSREHSRENLVGWVEDKTPPPLSPLAVAVRAYLDKHPRDARQPAGWIGSTLWAYDLFEGKPNPAATKAAVEELGGAAYLDGTLKRAKETAA